MKKIIFLIGVVVYSVTSNAQNYYNFTKSTETYVGLASTTTVNNGDVWSAATYGPFDLPFPVTVFGSTHTKFGFDDDNFVLTSSDGQITTNLKPLNLSLSDRNTNQAQTSLSPIAYKVDGESGNRILKLEIKNAGLEDELDGMFGPENAIHFLNFQVWIYELDQAIEYRFGATNITNIANITDGDPLVSLIYTEVENEENTMLTLGYVGGAILTPTYVETTNPDITPTTLTAMIEENTVYRFSTNTLSNKNLDKIKFKMYPNPTSGDLNFVFEEGLSENYFIYDLLGREVIRGEFYDERESKISVNQLESGTYIFKIGNSSMKFIKK